MNASVTAEVASNGQVFQKLVAPAVSADRSRQADEQAGRAPAAGKNLRPVAKFQPGGDISSGVYNPAKEAVGNQKLHHALNTTTLAMSTLVLIHSDKSHSYFHLLTALSGSSTETPGREPRGGGLSSQSFGGLAETGAPAVPMGLSSRGKGILGLAARVVAPSVGYTAMISLKSSSWNLLVFEHSSECLFDANKFSVVRELPCFLRGLPE